MNKNMDKMVESNRTEFKRELTDSLEKEVVAFLNSTNGGIIYIGIDDKTGKAVDIIDIDKTQLQIKDRIKNNIAPSALGLFDITIEKRDNKNIIKLIVAAGSERPYYLKKFGMSGRGCFVRIGSASEPMPERMIKELFTRRTRTSIGKIRSRQQVLTFEQLKIYYQAKELKLNEQFASNLEMLTESGEYNYAAYLLADKNGNSIKVAKYSGTNRVDLIENNEYGYCSLIKAAKQVLDKLEVENRTLAKITSKQRIEEQLINPEALREAVINAIIHNDYTDEVPPKFELFSDRIEITSKGGLPIGFSKEEFFAGYSHPRNKELMRIFKDLGFVEQLGSGVPRILEKYTEKAFSITDNYLRIIFPFTKGKVDEKTASEKHPKQLIIELIEENENITAKELASKINKSSRTVEKYLSEMKKQLKIKRIGSDRSGHWEVIKD